MKNKKMLLVVGIIIIIGALSVIIPKFMKQQNTVKNDQVKVGVLQFVTHPALDEIYSGIKEGLADDAMLKQKLTFIMRKQTNQKSQRCLAN